uniref:Testis expressed 50 n=1 Tax=Gopherus evgoodei TaxID=1825980 RepID=A0A8C4WDQ5_9SAUR
MFVRGVSLVFPIWIALFQETLCLCDRPSWVRVGWEILPEDLEQLQLGTPLQSNCLPYPLDQLSHCFTYLEIAKGWLEVLYTSCKIILFLLGGLCVCGLWSKLRRPQKKVSDGNEQGRNSADTKAKRFRNRRNRRLKLSPYLGTSESGLIVNITEHSRSPIDGTHVSRGSAVCLALWEVRPLI